VRRVLAAAGAGGGGGGGGGGPRRGADALSLRGWWYVCNTVAAEMECYALRLAQGTGLRDVWGDAWGVSAVPQLGLAVRRGGSDLGRIVSLSALPCAALCGLRDALASPGLADALLGDDTDAECAWEVVPVARAWGVMRWGGGFVEWLLSDKCPARPLLRDLGRLLRDGTLPGGGVTDVAAAQDALAVALAPREMPAADADRLASALGLGPGAREGAARLVDWSSPARCAVEGRLRRCYEGLPPGEG